MTAPDPPVLRDGAVSADPAVQAQLDRLSALSDNARRAYKIETVKRLLAALGDPQRALPPVFHVAGTNGKGSVCAYLRAAIEAEGMCAHVYTSPHLVRFNERIRIAGDLIGDEALAALLAEVLDTAEANGLAPSFYEATTAAALLAFARTPADAAIIEVGLGGRLDATNVFEAPAATGIAHLGIDHEDFLLRPETGTPQQPIARIAFEKAHIARPGVPLVTQKYAPEAQAEIMRIAAGCGARLIARGAAWESMSENGRLHYSDARGTLALPPPAMAGPFQDSNAALAIAMLRHQDALAIGEAALAEAMEKARWPARLHAMADGPLSARAPAGTPLWLDGGHNRLAGEALAAHFGPAGETIHLVTGMLSNKDPAAIVEPLAPWIARISVVPVPGHACHDADAFRAVAGGYGIAVSEAPDLPAALSEIEAGAAQIVLIAGSLYLAGEALRLNEEAPD